MTAVPSPLTQGAERGRKCSQGLGGGESTARAHDGIQLKSKTVTLLTPRTVGPGLGNCTLRLRAGGPYRRSRSSWGPSGVEVTTEVQSRGHKRHTADGCWRGGAWALAGRLYSGSGRSGRKGPAPALAPAPRRARGPACPWLCCVHPAGPGARVQEGGGLRAHLAEGSARGVPAALPAPSLSPRGWPPPPFPSVPGTLCLGPRRLPHPRPPAGVPGVALSGSPCATPASPSRPRLGGGKGQRVGVQSHLRELCAEDGGWT